MSQASWQHFHHGADIGVRGLGASLDEAFVQAALALTAVITDPGKVNPAVPVKIRCEAPDRELLLADWLNALIFETATRRMLFGRFELTMEGQSIRATAWGEKVDRERHQPAVEVKGATYTELRVEQTAGGTRLAQCVVDV